MTPEDQAEYDALPWERTTWTDEDEEEVYGEGESAGGSMDCVACGDMLEVGDDVFWKVSTPDYWHERCVPPQATDTKGWPRRVLGFAEAQRDYPDLMKQAGVLFPSLNGDSRAGIVSLVADTCPSCWSAARDCRCRDDS